MCAIVATCQCTVFTPIDWLISVASWPHLNGRKLLFSSSFFLLFCVFFRLPRDIHEIVHVLIRIWIRNRLYLPRHSHRRLTVCQCCLFCAPWVYRVYIMEHKPRDSRWNERLNESKLSVWFFFVFVKMMHFVVCVFFLIPLPNGKVEFIFGCGFVLFWFCFVLSATRAKLTWINGISQFFHEIWKPYS